MTRIDHCVARCHNETDTPPPGAAVNWLNTADIAFIHEHCGTQAAQVKTKYTKT